jgi:hypothetical protein
MTKARTSRAKKTAPQAPAMVALATEDQDLGMVEAATAQEQAQQAADEMGSTVYLRDPVTDEVIGSASPTGGDEETAPARDFKAEIARLKAQHSEELAALKLRHAEELALLKHQQAAAKTPGPRQPEGKTAELIALALRPEGVSTAELNEVSQWKGAPWRWNFHNPKGNGWAQRFGYQFRAEKGEGRQVRYFLTRE